MPLPSRDEAYALLYEWIESKACAATTWRSRRRCRAYARHHGEDEELWGITDRPTTWTMNGSPTWTRYAADGRPSAHGTALLSQRGHLPELIHAVEAHATGLGVPRESLMDKALLACDEMTISWPAPKCPDRNPSGCGRPSVKKKWKNRKFTEAIDRDENLKFIEELGVDFDEHVERVLNAMKGCATELGVDGSQG